jgi:uncharacterized protein (TIGR04222 family)
MSGPDFLLVYGLLTALALGVVLLLRRQVAAGRDDPGAGSGLSAYEVAYLAGGPVRAVAAALSALHTQGVIERTGRDILAVTPSGELPPAADRLDKAIVAVAQGRTSLHAGELASDPSIHRALDAIRQRLESAGVLASAADRVRMRWAVLPLVAVVLLGGARFLTGAATGRPVGFLAIVLLAVVILAVRLMRVPRLTRAGQAAVDALRTRHHHLSPSSSPAWNLYGPAGAAMAVGLFGGAALWAADPAFAWGAGMELERVRAASSSGSYGSGCAASSSADGGSSSGGSSSCGGSSCGGGCGGGGCGG